EIQISVQEGRPTFTEIWHRRSEFAAPRLPQGFSHATSTISPPANGLPSIVEYCAMLLRETDRKAIQHRTLFSRTALTIVLTHVFASIAAVLVSLHLLPEAYEVPTLIGEI